MRSAAFQPPGAAGHRHAPLLRVHGRAHVTTSAKLTTSAGSTTAFNKLRGVKVGADQACSRNRFSHHHWAIHILSHNPQVFRSSDGERVDLTTLWGPGERAVVAFARSFG